MDAITEDLNSISFEEKKEEIVEIKSNVEGLELYSDNYPFRLALRISKFDNEADYKKFIKNCEKTVRGSIEYKLWRDYIKDVLNVDKCMVTNENMADCGIEIHHHVPSLYQLLKAIINKNLDTQTAFSTFDVSVEAIEVHFQNKIGYLALISSMHEKLHNGALKVPKELIRGNYQEFLSNYSRYLDDEDLNQIFARLAESESNTEWSAGNYPAVQGVM